MDKFQRDDYNSFFWCIVYSYGISYIERTLKGK